MPVESNFKGFSKSYQKRNDLSTEAVCRKGYQNRKKPRVRSSGERLQSMDGFRILVTSSKPWSQGLASFYWKRPDHKYIRSFLQGLNALGLESRPRHYVEKIRGFVPLKLFTKHVTGPRKDGSELKSISCFSTGPGFSSQNPHQEVDKAISKDYCTLFWPWQAPTYMWETHIFIKIKINLKKSSNELYGKPDTTGLLSWGCGRLPFLD